MHVITELYTTIDVSFTRYSLYKAVNVIGCMATGSYALPEQAKQWNYGVWVLKYRE